MPRKRSPHPGIIVLPARPEKRQAASIRYVDPDTGKQRTERLPDGAGLPWLKQRSLELQQRRLELAAGQASAAEPGSLADMIDKYFDEADIKKSTAAMYKLSTNQLLAWGGVRSSQDLTLARLRDFRAWLLKLPKRNAQSANRDLKTVKAILEHSRKAGRCARLSREAILDGLELVKSTSERKPYLGDPSRALLDSSEDLGLRTYVMFLLLTGMRRTEAVNLTAGAVDFEAGLIRLHGHETKTGQWRDVEMSWSPHLYALCELLAAGKDSSRKLFPDETPHTLRRRLRAIDVDWDFQMLRRTTSTFLCSMPSVGVWRASKSLGHHPEIARKHYAGVVRTDAKVLEDAMGIHNETLEVLKRLRPGRLHSLPPTSMVHGL